jgi:NADPH-dependent 2,4-dienoyl-CoA reductase/sulfur reductase-like enzyme
MSAGDGIGGEGDFVETTSLLVVVAGPYGLAVAARAQDRGINTIVVRHPLGF